MNLIFSLFTKFKKLLAYYCRLLISVFSWLQFQSTVAFLKLTQRFIMVPAPVQAEGRLNLHLGCGEVDHKQFINIDGYPFPHVHYVQSIDKLPQFDNNSVDLIYASHCLEHFKYGQIEVVLQEWYRVLKKGAVLRLSVPDFDKLVEIYKIHNNDPDVILPQLMGGQNNRYNFHYTVFNNINLTNLLKSVGFLHIQEWQPGTSDLMTFNDFSIYKKDIAGKLYEISLNIEAVK